ncbi:hypothetical protein AB395_0000243 [Sinorhizobium fredii CCBAU 45436]|nr:hypothetical protein AB395_0000243 [Sinorhizobium fredii CCBAU 45436]
MTKGPIKDLGIKVVVAVDQNSPEGAFFILPAAVIYLCDVRAFEIKIMGTIYDE